MCRIQKLLEQEKNKNTIKINPINNFKIKHADYVALSDSNRFKH